MTSTEFHLGNNGHGDTEDLETQDELNLAYKKLSELKRGDGIITGLNKQDIGLLKQLLHTPDKDADFTAIVLICDFLSDEEADKELNAFYEAKRLGMDTQFNIDHALSRVAVNRKGSHRTSRAALIMDTISHQKYTTNTPGVKSNGNNPRSPLS